MAKILTDDELAVFFEQAISETTAEVPNDLMARVLADAAEIGMVYADPTSAKQGFWQQLFAPVGGFGGAFALGTFASIGLIIGLGGTETLYDLPVMGDILATFSGEYSNGSPFETLDFLMSES